MSRSAATAPLLPSPDQETRRFGGVFHPDGRPMHYTHGGDVCVRCRTPHDQWKVTPCFYPMTLTEVVAETAAMLEAVCSTTVSLSPREACEQARRLRDVERFGK